MKTKSKTSVRAGKSPKPASPVATKALDAGRAAALAELKKPVKPAKEPKAATPEAHREKKPLKVSALDAAATVLADSPTPMRAIDMIAEMGKRGLWTSPGGKTPEATLYAAITREIAAKGETARFAKKDRGLFVTNGGGK